MRTLSLFSLLSLFIVLSASTAQSQDGCFIGEIRMFGGNFAPRSWALCDGQLQSISQNPALFSILGTTFGGDGRTTFGLPDLRGRLAIHPGTGPGLTRRRLGEKGGQESVTLTMQQMPTHNHSVMAHSGDATTTAPAGKVLASGKGKTRFYDGSTPDVELSPNALGTAGGSQSHNNMPPYQGVNYIICLQGYYPSRN